MSPFADRHGKGGGLHHALLAGVGLDLEAAVLAPSLGHLRGNGGAKLDRAVVLLADDASGAGDDARPKQIQGGRIKEVDVAFLVVVHG